LPIAIVLVVKLVVLLLVWIGFVLFAGLLLRLSRRLVFRLGPFVYLLIERLELQIYDG
jgi:hypothetical protein